MALHDDRAIVVLVGTEKTLCTLADVVCEVTRTRGVTEIRMVDHGMSAMKKARFSNNQCWFSTKPAKKHTNRWGT